METKTPIQSKVLWFNTLAVLAIVIAEVLASTELKEVLGNYAYVLMIAGATINAILRPYTTKPLGDGEPKLSAVDKALREEAEEQGLV